MSGANGIFAEKRECKNEVSEANGIFAANCQMRKMRKFRSVPPLHFRTPKKRKESRFYGV